MPEQIWFYVILHRDEERKWKRIDTRHFETLEEAQKTISIEISCRFDDFFRYEISGDEHSRNVWDKKTHDWVYESRIEYYEARRVKN